jgi:hypothetical protein
MPDGDGVGVDTDAYPLTRIYRGSFLLEADKNFVPELVLTDFKRRQNLKFPESWNIKCELLYKVESEGENE